MLSAWPRAFHPRNRENAEGKSIQWPAREFTGTDPETADLLENTNHEAMYSITLRRQSGAVNHLVRRCGRTIARHG